jgi:D-alanyl-D-alanine carboxypeptidase/D-alanyl-D-alanine-endopeptidase (penicillin-binding protein 4)
MMRAMALVLLLRLGGGVALAQEGREPREDDATAAPSAPVDPGPPAGDAAGRERWLARRLAAIIDAHPELGAARVGVLVAEADTGRTLFARDPDERHNVASVTKLVTTAAALARLGPEYRFKTALLADRWEGKDTVDGNLYLRAAGDPSLATAGLWSLVDDLRVRGIRRVTGSLVIDDTFFDENSTPPAYDQKKEDGYFRAPIGAASLNDNAVTVRVKAGTPGEAAQVTLLPASEYFIVKNVAVTTERGRTNVTIAAKGAGARTEIDVAGSIRAGDEREVRKRIDNPPLYAGATLRALLVAAGVKIGRLKLGAAPRTARVLAERTSEPLSVLIRDLNKYSNNFMAETLLKTMGAEVKGAPGTWAKGLDVVRGYLADVGVAPGYRYDNGSGLYDSNRFSPADLVKVLRAAGGDYRTGADYVASLAVAGADGTLAHRMIGGPAERYVRAKTGTLKNVIALAGFVGGTARPPIAFAVLASDVPEAEQAAARVLGNEVCAALALFADVK